MSEFSDLWDGASEALDSTFGEVVRIVPRAAGQYKGVGPDAHRAPVEVSGRFMDVSPNQRLGLPTARSSNERLGGIRQGTELGGTTTIMGAVTRLRLSAQVTAGLGWTVRTGDALELIERPGAPRYGVVQAPINDLGEVTMDLALEA